ncbi:substrate-binding domain-containing protein [Streptomyces sp. NPDC007984]|uniref:sugar ABC transporter substrate-binding protein n=1 Tax=Streptomyces sp. NPDC007984 TaxID=3364801 RepID=UPI0036E446BC
MHISSARRWGPLLIPVLLAIGCGTQSTADAGKDGNEIVIGHSVPHGADPVLAAQAHGLEVEAKRQGYKVITTDANVDPGKQISDVETMLQRGIDALVIWPLDATSIQPELDRVRAAGIPVVVHDTASDGPYFTNLDYADHQAAYEAAEYLAELNGPGSSAVAVLGPETIETFRERNAGFREGAEAAGLKILDAQTNERITPDATAALARTWKQRFGSEAQGLFDPVDLTALAAAAVKDDKFAPDVVGLGGGDDAIEAVRSGVLAATWDLRPTLIGRALVWAVSEALADRKLPADITIELPRIDHDNVGQVMSSEDQLDADVAFGTEKRDGKTYLTVDIG